MSETLHRTLIIILFIILLIINEFIYTTHYQITHVHLTDFYIYQGYDPKIDTLK